VNDVKDTTGAAILAAGFIYGLLKAALDACAISVPCWRRGRASLGADFRHRPGSRLRLFR
jgi:hypothetical protein